MKKFSKKSWLLPLCLTIIAYTTLAPLCLAQDADTPTTDLQITLTQIDNSKGNMASIHGLVVSLMEFGNWVFNWSMSNPFKMSYTNMDRNEVIKVGWPLMRDLANMLFVLGLAYIALSTALNFASFNTKKAFGRLVAAALLINFTPIICGVIVDVCNVIFNYFVRGTDFTPLITAYIDQVQATKWWQFGDFMGSAFPNYVMVFYGFFAGLALLLFGCFFIVRYIAIWLLVIFSPLAFVAWIFDATKKYFSNWWSKFLQWSFAAIPAGFLLYLANQVIVLAKNEQLLNPLSQDPSNGVLKGVAPYIVAAFFMHFSYVMALQSSAGFVKRGFQMAQGTARKYTQKYGQTVTAGAASFSGGAVAGGAVGAVAGAQAGQGMRGKIGGFATGLARGMGTGSGREAGRDAFWKTYDRIPLIGKPGQWTQRKAKRSFVGDAQTRVKGMPIDEVQELARSMDTSARRAADKAAAIERLMTEGKLEAGKMNEQDLQGIITHLRRMIPSADQGALKAFKKSDPQFSHLVDSEKFNTEITKIAKDSNKLKTIIGEGLDTQDAKTAQRLDAATDRIINSIPKLNDISKLTADELKQIKDGLTSRLEKLGTEDPKKQAGATVEAMKEIQNSAKEARIKDTMTGIERIGGRKLSTDALKDDIVRKFLTENQITDIMKQGTEEQKAVLLAKGITSGQASNVDLSHINTALQELEKTFQQVGTLPINDIKDQINEVIKNGNEAQQEALKKLVGERGSRMYDMEGRLLFGVDQDEVDFLKDVIKNVDTKSGFQTFQTEHKEE